LFSIDIALLGSSLRKGLRFINTNLKRILISLGLELGCIEITPISENKQINVLRVGNVALCCAEPSVW
jgi:hypothetical protein